MDIFNPDIYPESDGHPAQIELGLGQMHCYRRLCWLKQGEHLGWITWWIGSNGKEFYPECTNYQNSWPEIDLQCPENGNISTSIWHLLIGENISCKIDVGRRRTDA